MSLCNHRQRSKSPDSFDEKENLSVHRASSFSSKDRKLERRLAEKDSLEACLWLSAAGFPQYVQMFEEGRFPMVFKLADLKRDHGFLDSSSLNSLIKRLEVLNECSVYNLNSKPTFNLSPVRGEVSPLSRLWQFKDDSKRWTRMDSIPRNASVRSPLTPVVKRNVKAGSMDFLSQIGSNDGLNNFTPLQKPRSPLALSPFPHSSCKSVSTNSLSTVAYTDSIVFPKSMVKTRNNPSTPKGSGERQPRTLPPNTLSIMSPSLSLSCQSESSLNTSSHSNKFNQSDPSQLSDPDVSGCGVIPSTDTSYRSCFDTFEISSAASDTFPHNNIRADFPINGQEVMECIHSSGSSFELPEFDPTFNAREHVTMERLSSPLPGSQTVMRPLPVSSRVRAYQWDVSENKDTEATRLHIYELSIDQIVLLKKLSLLKLTNLIETHSSVTKARLTLSQLVSNNKLYRQQQPTRANQIFGVALTSVLEQTGQCIPQVILSAMKFILEEANDCVGIFRKCAGKSKLDALKSQCESNNSKIDFSSVAPYEAASLIKNYFRQLPEPLFTFRLSQILLHIFSSFPSSHRLEAIQCVILIQPDCNREALHTLLHFLQRVAIFHTTNKMTAYNLAVCFAPTLLALSLQEWSPEKRPRVRCGGHFPTSHDLMATKEVIQSKAATESLTFLITNCDVIFTIPTDLWKRCESAETMYSSLPDSSPCPDKIPPLENSFSARLHSEYKSLISNKVQLMLMDSSSRRSGWRLHKVVDGVEVSHRTTHDSLVPLWRATTSIHTSQESLLKRILEERNMWDEDIARWQVVPLDHQTEVFRYATHSMYGPHPPREYCVIRSWHLDTLSGSVVIHSMSIKEKRAQTWSELPSIQGDLLNETFIIQKLSPVECRLVLFSQNDTRGRSPDFYWYYGAYISRNVQLLKNSFNRKGHRNYIETQV